MLRDAKYLIAYIAPLAVFIVGRIFLNELTRHSDHHYKTSRNYQVLRHLDESPQLPYGYPTSILLALAPPLWFRMMDPRVREWMGEAMAAE